MWTGQGLLIARGFQGWRPLFKLFSPAVTPKVPATSPLQFCNNPTPLLELEHPHPLQYIRRVPSDTQVDHT